MSTEKLTRLVGLPTILAGLLLALFPLLHPNHDPDGFRGALWIPAHLAPHIAAIILFFTLAAVYARQGERNGILGLLGYVVPTIGNSLLLMVAWVELFVFPFIGLNSPELMAQLDSAPPPGVAVAALVMNVTMALGYVLLGLSIIRAKLLPRSVGLLLVVASPIFNLGDLALRMLLPEAQIDLFMFGAGLFAASIAWLGWALWQTPVRRPLTRTSQAPSRSLGATQPA